MKAQLTRILATWLLVFSLLTPFAGGWAMALGLGEGRIFVICTGDGLRSFHMDENGDATPLSDEAIACVLSSAANTADAVRTEPGAQRLLYVTAVAPLPDLSKKDRLHLAPLPRAPPMI
ncbi:MAG: hypothetical protein AAGL23_04125 [Pseudomonadota bacterium]